eukprot:m.19281 g.19281  ORF g.19281 m.19281 type:complete len:269 (+) comp12400_c0_seq1:266-1072(+)
MNVNDTEEINVPTDKIIKAATKDYALENVGSFSLISRGVEEYGDLLNCFNLIELRLPRNRITGNLTPLATLIYLETLDLSQNAIQAWTGVSQLKHLNTLELFGNRIQNLQNLDELITLKLRRFSLCDVTSEHKNPVCNTVSDYFNILRQQLPTLIILDGRRIHSETDAFFSEASTLQETVLQLKQDERGIDKQIVIDGCYTPTPTHTSPSTSQVSQTFDGLLQQCKDEVEKAQTEIQAGNTVIETNNTLSENREDDFVRKDAFLTEAN